MNEPKSNLDRAIVMAKEKGYYVREDGVVISHLGRERSRLIKRHKGGVYDSFSFVVGSRPTRQTVNIPVHRFLAYLKYGDAVFSDEVKVYHKNNDPLDNRIENIILATRSEIMMGRSQEDRSRIAGSPHRRGGQRKHS